MQGYQPRDVRSISCFSYFLSLKRIVFLLFSILFSPNSSTSRALPENFTGHLKLLIAVKGTLTDTHNK